MRCCFPNSGAVCLGMALLFTATSAAEEPGGNVARPIRLRMEWGGGSPQLWSGLLEVSQGRFERPVSLGVEADEPGTIWIDDQALWIQRRTARVYDGFDVTVVAPAEARLNMTLQSAGPPPAVSGRPPARARLDVSIAELYTAEKTIPVGEDGARLVVRRRPGDALAVHVDRPHLIYKPGEHFVATVRLNLFPSESGKRKPKAGSSNDQAPMTNIRPRSTTRIPHSALRIPNSTLSTLQWQLTGARSKTVLDRGVQTIPPDADSAEPGRVPLDIALPEDEGAYDIRLRLSGDVLSEQNAAVQVLVLSGESQLQSAGGKGGGPQQRVDVFQPDKAGLFRRIVKRDRIKRLNEAFGKLLGLFPSGDASGESSGPDSQGGPPAAVDGPPAAVDGPPAAVDWAAFRLKIRQPGRPHRLVVSAPAGVSQSLGVSLLEANAAGQLMPVGLDSGVYIDARDPFAPATGGKRSATGGKRSATGGKRSATGGSDGAGELVRHQIIFWPKARSPVLLLHNLHAGKPFEVTNVEVFELESLKTKSRAPKAESSGLQLRLVGPYMHKPLLPENFGAPEAYDAPSRRSLDDWVTFHTAARRLAEYLRYAGFNSFLLAVLADGSTIYPSRLLQPTPRYDTGVYFSTGQDIIRKDVLELLYRVFDREGLVLIPELQFSTPLPALEQILARDGDGARGLELIGRDGRSWRETRGSARGLAPHYNPLDPRVQKAVLDVVGELVERYRSHPSFQGVAVELSSVGYLQFPGLNWGYDDETIARFRRATGMQVPGDRGPDRYRRRHEFLTGKGRGTWVRWRCEELARFHQRLAQVVTEAHPTAQFILSGNRVLRGSNPDDDLYQALKSGDRLEALLAPKGLDFSLNAKSERMMLLRPSLWGFPDRPLADALNETVNASRSLDAAFRAPARGSLFYHAPCECRIAEFDSLSPWQPAYTWLAAHASPAGAANRKRYAHALAAGDAQMIFDGGWMIPFGSEEHTRRIRDVIEALPAVSFHRKETERQPAVVRTARHGGKTFLYVVNDFPDVIDVRLHLSCSAQTRLVHLGRPREWKLRREETGGSAIRVHLEPYDVWACELSDANTRVHDVDVFPADRALKFLAGRIRQFERQISEVHQSAQAKKTFLKNPGFERTPEQREELPGWKVPTENSVFWSLDRRNPRSGDKSLMLASNRSATGGKRSVTGGKRSATGGKRSAVAVLSSPLPATDGRFLTMSVWLRSNRNAADIRLAFEATHDGRKYVESQSVKVDTRWRRYEFQVKDIPDQALEDAQVTVEMRDSGKVWIDDVDIQMYRLTPDDLNQLTKVYSAVTLAWDEKRYGDCRMLLESYWGQLLFDEEAASPHERTGKTRMGRRLPRLFRR